MAYIDRARWAEAVRHPAWYLVLRPEYEALLARARAAPPSVGREIADEVYGFFEDALESRDIALGSSGPAWDSERRPVDTAVIHHTNLGRSMSIRRMDAIHLTRIYASYYADPAPSEAGIRGEPIFSGHFRGKRQVFVAYHWVVRRDGSRERLLDDHETGWHAGDWDVNCRSVGICLDGAFHAEPPPQPMLASTAELLRGEYPAVEESRLLGHHEVNPRTTCPGDGFLGGWKERLAEAFRAAP